MALLPPDLLPIFNALPGAVLLLTPDLRIAAASDEFLAATMTQRDAIVGQLLFDAFPENPQAPEAHAVSNVRASLLQVLATGQPHEMAPQHYDIPDPAHPGRFIERHWLSRHTPVLDAAGQVQFLIQSAQDITARHVAERLLRDSQAAEQAAHAAAEAQGRRLFHILENFPAVVASYRGPEHVFDLVSHRFQRDFPTRTIKGLPVREALPELEGQQYYEILDGVYRTGEPFYGTELETWVDLTNTGKLERQYYNVCFQATRDAEGRIDGILNFAYDVTDAVLARQQVQQLNQQLEARMEERTREALALQAKVLTAAQRQAQERESFYQVFDQTAAIVGILRGPQHRFDYINPSFQQLFAGRSLAGLDYATALPDAAAQGFVTLLDQVYRTGETFFGNEVPFTPDPAPGQLPRTAYFNFAYQAVREAGDIAGISIFAFDVTEQVLARQEREVQRQRLLGLFQEAPAGICILAGPELVFEFANPGYQQLLPGHVLLGRSVFEVVPEILGTPVETMLRQGYATGLTQEVQGALVPVARAADGVLEDRYFTFVYQGRRNDQGQVDGIMVFAFEVTEQVEARRQVEGLNQELAASNAQLTRTNVDLDNFIYTASHDLKAPITNLEGLLYLLEAELPADVTQDELVAGTLTRMLDSIERFKRTIDHLTEVAKLQQAHAPAHAAVDLAAVVEDVRLDLAPLLRESNAKLGVYLDGLLPIHFSEKNLRSVVYNLVSNALKYRHPDRRPHVDVRGHRRPGHTVLEVHDNGLGLAAHQLPQLFGMFQRFHDHVEGTGIGLFMVKRMVENAGGRLEVHSQLGAGTTFFVHFPHAA